MARSFQALIQRMRAAGARFGRAREGATAVELALVAAPFFLTLVAIAELAMISYVQTNLDLAMSETARRIRTGEVLRNGATAGQLREDVCGDLNRIMTLACDGLLFLDVREFENFDDVDLADPSNGGALDAAAWAFEIGDANDIILARAFYRWSVLTPFFESIFGNRPGGERVVVSSILFRNEPFPAGGGGGGGEVPVE